MINKKPVLILDLDHTLAIPKREFAEIDWHSEAPEMIEQRKEYHNSVHTFALNRDPEIHDTIKECSERRIVILTGRPESTRVRTQEWIADKFRFKSYQMFMRRDEWIRDYHKVYGSASAYKKAIFFDYIWEHYSYDVIWLDDHQKLGYRIIKGIVDKLKETQEKRNKDLPPILSFKYITIRSGNFVDQLIGVSTPARKNELKNQVLTFNFNTTQAYPRG